ncbi:MAG TPA: ABC transporter permease, partial [Candidatus Udaeobacter sp.]|nr:ABC transporter permease [Candidatus Udaeobacter sp.]
MTALLDPPQGSGRPEHAPRRSGRFGFSAFELFVARRYLWSRPRQSFIALISLISICGVIVGVWVLTTTLSAMNGFENEVRQKIVGANAHIVVLSRDPAGVVGAEELARELLKVPEVTGAAPMVYSKAMLAARGRADGVVVKGVELARERHVTDVPLYITPQITDIDSSAASGLPGIVLGFDVALRLAVGVGDTVVLSSPLRTVHSPLGSIPVIKQFEVVGIFHSGMYEYDASFCYVSIRSAQGYFGLD